MPSFLSDFHFPLLSDPSFKEDSVREELISPLLRALGYSAAGPHSIQRSKSLVHPFVYIGTKSHRVHITPDYTLSVDGKAAWVLDAKAPSEEIRRGKHREQAYSYAIHKDVRVPIYALCNGHRLIAFHISEEHPLIDVNLNQLTSSLDPLRRVLSPVAVINPEVSRYWPDLGVHHFLLGYTPRDKIISDTYVDVIMRIDDERYTIAGGADMDGIDMLGSFDFDATRLAELLSLFPVDLASRIRSELRRHPFQSDLREVRPLIRIHSQMGLTLVELPAETFLPFFVRRFTASPLSSKE